MKNAIALLAAAGLLANCTGTGPVKSTGVSSAAYYDYILPETSAKVSLAVTIVECLPNAAFKIEPTVTVAAVRGPAKYRLVGGNLSQWFTSHDLSLASYETGALKSLNSADADKTFAVVTNVVKGVISAVAIAGAPNPTGIDCSAKAAAAITLLKKLKAQRSLLAGKLASADAVNGQGLTAALAAIDAEIGRLSASEDLRFELSAEPIDLSKGGGTIAWKKDDFPDSLMMVPPGTLAQAFTIAYCLEDQADGTLEAKCTPTDAANGAAVHRSGSLPPKSCGEDADCSRTIVMREPRRAFLTVIASGAAFGKRNGKPIKALALPIAQWGEPTMLSTNLGLGKSRTVGFGLDEYGARNSFAWKSDARADTITGGASSVLEQGATLADKLRADEQLAKDKAELDRLDTGQKLQKARACQAILDAGGTCPE